MTKTTRSFIEALGGYRRVAGMITKKPTTIHSAMQAGVFPAAWYDGFCALARAEAISEPNRELFNFLKLPGNDGGPGGVG